MAMSINSNIAALTAQGNVAGASGRASASIGRLSSGNRINRASDDVAGLAIGVSLSSQVTTLRTALANATAGASLLQVADGGLGEIAKILQRQKAIATQAVSGQLTDANRALLNQEFTNLTAEVDRISTSTNFNGVKLLGGGLGTSTALANTSLLASTLATTGLTSGQGASQSAAVASTDAVQAFDTLTGATKLGTAAGQITFVDSTGTTLTNAQFLNINSAVVGQFSGFKLSNIIYGVAALGSAKLTATINGVDFVGTVTGGTTATILQNGSTYIKVGYSASVGTFTNAGTAALAQTQIGQDFKTTVVARTSAVNGVDFTGTRLAGAIGSATATAISTRLYSVDASISNFRYVGNGGAADTSIVSVDVNGKAFTARNIKDALATAAGRITFVSDDNQLLYVDLTGLTDAFTGGGANTQNIRQDLGQRAGFINALNLAVSKVGAGLNFAIGTTSADSIKVSLSSAGSASIYNGATLDITTSSTAQTASDVLDGAITKVTSLRATVGALQSRFNFAGTVIQSSLENQDAARGTLLDTDVSAESTAYSTAQVQLQAGIAVLAQANQMTQQLLKLLNGG